MNNNNSSNNNEDDNSQNNHNDNVIINISTTDTIIKHDKLRRIRRKQTNTHKKQ